MYFIKLDKCTEIKAVKETVLWKKLKGIYIFFFLACSSSPCLHDGTCTLDKIGGYRCACLAGFTGNRCESCEYKCVPNSLVLGSSAAG